MKVSLVEYGAGNVTSVERAIDRLGAATERVSAPEEILRSEALLLPGVGHFAALALALDKQNLRAALSAAIRRGVPFLGICLGLQLLFESSEEAPGLDGLGLLPGQVRLLPSGVRLPHMGWNSVWSKRQSRLLEGIREGTYFYFAHSYAASDEQGDATACSAHGTEFPAVFERGNISGVQFHPEKSGDAGACLLDNFLRMTR